MSKEILITRFDFDQPALILCSLSTATAVAVFTLSMLDLGIASFYLGPIVSALTLTFHTTYFILRHIHHASRHRQPRLPKTLPPAFSIGSIASVCSLSLLWTGPLSMTVWTARAHLGGSIILKGHSNVTILFAQIVLCAVNLLVLTVIVPIFIFGRRDFLRSHSTGSPMRSPASLEEK